MSSTERDLEAFEVIDLDEIEEIEEIDLYEATARLGLPDTIGADEAADEQPERIGHYELLEVIGQGSFGKVYRASDPRLDRDVAIKVAEPEIASDPVLLELFRREARIQARLEHANIVPIYDLVEDASRFAIVMRLIQGEDLDRKLRELIRPLTPLEALPILDQVSGAIGSAHERGVVHRDLKPGNIRLSRDGAAIVLDFGIAAVGNEAPGSLGTLGGTPHYMSPEQIAGDPVDARSDIYSLAMTMFKALTSHHPFENAKSIVEMLDWQVQRDPLPPVHFNPAVPEPLSDVIMQALSKKPRDRFRGCSDFLRAVSAAVGYEATSSLDVDNARWNPRADVNLDARLQMSGEPALPARVVNLSASGAAVRSSRALAPGAKGRLGIAVPLADSRRVVSCDIVVQRVNARHEDGSVELGVGFEGLSAGEHEVLSNLVRSVLVSGPD